MRPSLLLRLSILLFCAQIVGSLLFAAGLYAQHLVAYWTQSEDTWSLFGLAHAQDLVVKSLVMREDGSILLEPTAELRDYLKSAPQLRYAAMDIESGGTLPGASPELVDALKVQGAARAEYIGFRLEIEPGVKLRGMAVPLDTPAGRYLIAICGWRVRGKDLWDDFLTFEWLSARTETPTLIVTLCVGWLALRRGLAPLKDAANEARRIDLDSLDQRLATGNLPIEILPLVETINEALSRLDEGLSRQTRFLANAAHELRTPVMILSARAAGAEKPTFKKDIERDARRIRNIVEQLLAFARLGKSARLPAEAIDLSELVPAMVDDYALLAVKNDKHVEYEGGEAPLFVRGERRALESVVANLIDNALRAEPDGGTVLIRLTEDGAIAVVDHGEGVAPLERELIFEPFWRKSGAAGGTGLGLAIARELVEKHGGRISLEDTPGGGATFKVAFPIVTREAVALRRPV
jgi:signal transduction histidine kinase